MSSKPPDRQRRISPIGWLTMGIVVVCFVVAFRFGRDDLDRLVDAAGWMAPLVIVPIHAMVAATPFPSDVIVVANGAIFGYLPAVAYSWLGWFLGAILEFHAARSASQLVATVDRDRLPMWLRRFPVSSPWFLILGRQIPWGGAHLTIIPAGASGVSWSRFLWCSAVGIVPGALLLPAIGAKLLN